MPIAEGDRNDMAGSSGEGGSEKRSSSSNSTEGGGSNKEATAVSDSDSGSAAVEDIVCSVMCSSGVDIHS